MSIKSFRDVGVAVQDSELVKVTASASTLQELIATIPRTYQAVLGDLLQRKYRIAHKHANVQSTIAAYDRHEKDNSFPPVIRNSLKEPRLQFAKEFLGSTDGSESPALFKAAVFSARKAVLKSALEQKNLELDHLATLIAPDKEAWTKAVREVAGKVASNAGGSLTTEENRSAKLVGITPAAHTEFLIMDGACEIYTYRVLALARASIDRADIQKLAKVQLKDNADVEMTDVNSKEPAVKELIREELKAFRLELAKSQKQNQSRKSAVKVQKKKTARPKNGGGNGKKKGKKSR